MGETALPAWSDLDPAAGGGFYQVTALDFAGNESEPAQANVASATPVAGRVFALQPAAPNPFNPSTRLSFTLSEGGPVRLEIYDISGRLVRILVDEVRPAGEYEVRWAGRSDGGRPVASGTYFARLQSQGRQDLQTLMLVK